jgi:acetylornithine deacetylase/succinyl-diaminopimelate desuccinylase-like protein
MKNFNLSPQILSYVENSKSEILNLLRELAVIPAPSNHEEQRANFCLKKFREFGVKNAYVDEVNNVICPINCENAEEITGFCAHTDIVFPDVTTLPLSEDDEYLYCPGIGDDTACLVLLMLATKIAISSNLAPKNGILIVANSCEEGLGNLKGIKQIIKDFPNISKVYTFDGQYSTVVNKCVGSDRFEITVQTQGGHSFGNFGNLNAISIISEFIYNLYNCNVPNLENSKTTFNVGTICGGTSVNTIAQSASFTYEYRSDNIDCIKIMNDFFRTELNKIQNKYPNAKIDVKLLGSRPCQGNVNEESLEKMTNDVISVYEKYSSMTPRKTMGSTDCNIPMSLGIPAICVGNFIGSGAHTREEKVLKSSLVTGLKITAHILLSHFIS